MSRSRNPLIHDLLATGAVALFLFAGLGSADDAKESDVAKRLNASGDVLNQIMSSREMSIPSQVLAEAKCIAVVPSLVKLALGVGGRHGKGVATCRVANRSEERRVGKECRS